MKILGIDPSSSITGNALIDGNKILSTDNWKKNNTKSDVWNLWDYYEWQVFQIKSAKPDMAAIEFLSVSRNMNSVRVVSHYQAAAALACKANNLMVIEARVSSARKEALGRGNMSKDEAWEAVKKMFPNHKFSAKTRGGTDEADALVIAIAAPGIAEKGRR